MMHSDRYWLPAFFTGTFITVALFMVLPNLNYNQPQVEEPTIVIDFMQWREPKPLPKSPQAVVPVQPKLKPKPKPRPLPEPKVTPPEKTTLKRELPVIDTDRLNKPDAVSEVEKPPIIAPQEPVTVAPTVDAQSKTKTEQLPEPVPLFKLTSLPRFVHKVEPAYPESMRALGKEATVKLELLIDRKGKVRQVTVLKSGGEAFDKAATEALLSSSFIPGNIEGQPVAVRMRIPIRFKLR